MHVVPDDPPEEVDPPEVDPPDVDPPSTLGRGSFEAADGSPIFEPSSTLPPLFFSQSSASTHSWVTAPLWLLPILLVAFGLFLARNRFKRRKS